MCVCTNMHLYKYVRTLISTRTIVNACEFTCAYFLCLLACYQLFVCIWNCQTRGSAYVETDQWDV